MGVASERRQERAMQAEAASSKQAQWARCLDGDAASG